MDSLRILNTGDWRLSSPCKGIAYYPENLATALATSTQASIERLIDFAIGDFVDVMVVGGNTIDPSLAGPADFAFLLRQLKRLEQAQIPVIWNWSWLDQRNQWPRCFNWPSNVRQIIGDTPQTITLDLTPKGRVTFVGIELNAAQPISPSWFEGLTLDGLTFGVAYGAFSDRESNIIPPLNWLLSGNSYGKVSQDHGLHHYYAGSPQGRSLKERGPHGAALLEYHENDVIDFQFINTSKLEYESITIDVGGINTPDSLAAAAVEQLAKRTFDQSIIYVIELELTEANCHLCSLPFIEIYNQARANLQASLTQLSPNLILSRLSPSAKEEEFHTSEEEVLGEFLFITRELKEQGWSTLNLSEKLPAEESGNWSELLDDLSGLRTILAAESLGKHLLGISDKEVA